MIESTVIRHDVVRKPVPTFRHHALALICACGLAGLMSAGPAAASPHDPLAAYRDKARVLAVVAPDAADPRLAEQRTLYAAMKAGARERDLVLVEGVGSSSQARALRARFGVGPSDFVAVLIGKDGGDKLTSRTPIGAAELFPLIDTMPMRREEMERPQG